MNSNFNDEQIKAYAAAFEEGDAIWCDGKWWELSKLAKNSRELTCGSPNRYFIRCFDGKLAISGFKEEEHPYRVTTLEHYELQGGEKIVWLGNVEHFNFGEVYEVKHRPESEVNVFVYDNDDYVRIPKSESWAVIPRYVQVRPIERKKVETSDIANALYKRYYNVLQNALHNDIKSALQENNYSLVIELSELAIEMEESK